MATDFIPDKDAELDTWTTQLAAGLKANMATDQRGGRASAPRLERALSAGGTGAPSPPVSCRPWAM
jgi:hypothetical protein